MASVTSGARSASLTTRDMEEVVTPSRSASWPTLTLPSLSSHYQRCALAQGLHTKLVARASLAIGDAFNFGGVQRVQRFGVASILGEDSRDAFARHRKSSIQRPVTSDLAVDVAIEAPRLGPHLAHPAHGLFITGHG